MSRVHELEHSPYVEAAGAEEDYEMVFDVVEEHGDLHRRLLDLENEVVETRITFRDVVFKSEVARLRREYLNLCEEVTDLHRVIGRREPAGMRVLTATPDRAPTEKEEQLYREMWLDGEWDEKLQRLTRASERIERRLQHHGDRLDAYRALAVSVLAVVITVATTPL